jgi:hypothetical protein
MEGLQKDWLNDNPLSTSSVGLCISQKYCQKNDGFMIGALSLGQINRPAKIGCASSHYMKHQCESTFSPSKIKRYNIRTYLKTEDSVQSTSNE